MSYLTEVQPGEYRARARECIEWCHGMLEAWMQGRDKLLARSTLIFSLHEQRRFELDISGAKSRRSLCERLVSSEPPMRDLVKLSWTSNPQGRL